MPEVRRSAGGIVLGDHGTVALVRQQSGGWFLPKGGIEDGETDEDAARREIEEECGLTDLELLDDLGTYERPRIGKDGSYDSSQLKEIHMYLFAAVPHSTLRPDMEIQETAWVPLARLPGALADTKDRAWFVTVFQRVRQAVQRD